jgi:guanylate kinase
MSDAAGTLFVVSAPSGTGKTTLVERLVATGQARRGRRRGL